MAEQERTIEELSIERDNLKSESEALRIQHKAVLEDQSGPPY